MTPDEVRAFQAGAPGGPRPIDYFGRRLVVDGDLGPKTRWALDIATLPLWRQAIVRSALQDVGWREDGVNGGPYIDMIMARCRLDNDVDGDGPSEDGWPWCGAEYSYHTSLYSPHKFVPDASVRRLREQLHVVPPFAALPGDMASKMHDAVHGHTGTLIAIGKGWAASVDGNLGNRRLVVKYPAHDRQYHSVEPQPRVPTVPDAIEQYRGSTR